MAEISTHILDTSRGHPAIGVEVTLSQWNRDRWQNLGKAVTDKNGRISDLHQGTIHGGQGLYRLQFATEKYFAAFNTEALYPWVDVVFRIEDTNEKYHIPLLLSGHGYTTYRGS
tara:strand:+ start:166 stop:507 length:342 start_codon:yes stop_codon:yes gene_type:complete